MQMHKNEASINVDSLRELLAKFFPQFSKLTITKLNSIGTDNHVYRLGSEMCVRLPRIESAEIQLKKEVQWLPKLQNLPLEIPSPILAAGSSAQYPFSFAIYSWIDGDDALNLEPQDMKRAAKDLACFVSALQKNDASAKDAPTANRSESLKNRDAKTREAIAQLGCVFDAKKALKIWEEALRAHDFKGLPVWLHGDLFPQNLLVKNGALSAAIDFGMCGIGDPACDLLAAWGIFSSSAREVFLRELNPDEPTLLRARGLALSVGFLIFSYYKSSNPRLAKLAQKMIAEIFEEYS